MPRCQQISRQHLPFMSIKLFVQAQHRGRGEEMVSLCSLIRFNWHVRWPRPARVPLLSLRLNILWVPCGHSGRLLTHYRPYEVRNSIYPYRKIHIDYQSEVSYRFISIIYGNTTNCKYIFVSPKKFHPLCLLPQCRSWRYSRSHYWSCQAEAGKKGTATGKVLFCFSFSKFNSLRAKFF